MTSIFCVSCLAEAVLYIGAAIAAIFALRSFTRASTAPERISALLMDRLGSCRPCILASALLLAASLAALAAALRFTAPLLVLVFCSLAAGVFLSLAIAHLFMYYIKKNAPPPPPPAPAAPLAPPVPRKCCGQK